MITNELISEIKSKINDNQKQAITGGVLQGVLVDMVNGLTTKGLTFLGILGPNDPAPSDEPSGGYYLSFQASTKETPYFNGVHLHRYCLLIWTQNETGRWKFKRIKYEDHRGPKRIVIGRALPVHYKNGSYTIHLSGDGTRDTYAVSGAQVLRGGGVGTRFNDAKRSFLASDLHINNADDISRKYSGFSFDKEDDNKDFISKVELRNFLLTKRIANLPFMINTCSQAYKIFDYGRAFWVPNIRTNRKTCFMCRVVRDYTNRPNSINGNTIIVVKKIPQNVDGRERNICELRKYKRLKRCFRNQPDNLFTRYAGISDNCISLAGEANYVFTLLK